MSEAKVAPLPASFGKQNWPGSKVRQTFIDFFCQQQGHKFIKSSPILPPPEETTLLFANSGMNQFKPVFLGQLDEKHEFAGLKRAANTQKCLRAGGKHNDLEEVGFDVYHHTFFEMLGNWSFGDYFKEEAITWSWTLLTEVYGIPADRLYATYFGGDPRKPNVPPDLEAKEIWSRYLPANRILPFKAKENFWEMGATGPCGPCTEIHYDRIGGREVPEKVNLDDPDVLEIWNNVFMQYYCDEHGVLSPLPAQSVDTGMGFERLTSVLQGVRSNYDTDVFDPIFNAIRADTGCRPYTGKIGAADVDGVDMAYRVVADHVRALTFSIADRIDPDADGRGYVLRRILRRGVRYARQFLNSKPGFFSRLCGVVIDTMGDAFPELIARREYVIQVISFEEQSFMKTLDRGLKRFNLAVDGMKSGDELDGKTACNLFTTYGFPIDLTRLMCQEKKFILNESKCEQELERIKDLSRRESKHGSVELKLEALQTDYLAQSNVAFTDDEPKYDWKSVGSGPTLDANVKAIYVGLRNDMTHNVGFVDSVDDKVGRFGIILDRTNFYGEKGGQTFDIGELKLSDGSAVVVVDTQFFGGFVLHTGILQVGQKLSVGAAVTCHVDYARRALVAKNHTTTHLLNFALRELLVNTDQQGSLVDADKSRFDFNFSKALTIDQIQKLQSRVQGFVDQKAHVDKLSCPKEAALAITALRAMFGQQYPSIVRVVAVIPAGQDYSISSMIAAPTDEKWMATSVEFCGGTHLDNAGEAGRFIITSEGSVKAGVRRIIAVTGEKSLEILGFADELSARFAAAENLTGSELQGEIKGLTAALADHELPLVTKATLEKALDGLNKKDIKWKKSRDEAMEKNAEKAAEKWSEEKKGARHIIASVDVNGSSKSLKKIASSAMTSLNIPVLVYSVNSENNSVSVFATVPQSISARFSANDWASAVVSPLGGKAGGNAQTSQGQARDASQLQAAVALQPK